MTDLELQCVAILRAALDEEYGIAVHTNDPFRARATLYRVRQLTADTEFAHLTIRVSPDNTENEIWIVRNTSRLIDLPSTNLL